MSAWIEIVFKFRFGTDVLVALHVSAWIEIALAVNAKNLFGVALHVSAWIEILILKGINGN